MDFPPVRAPLVTYGLFPLVVGGAVVAASLAVRAGTDPAAALPGILVAAIAVCLLAEWRHPLEARWSMTRHTLGRRDLPFLVSGLVVERACEVGVAAIARSTGVASGFGPVARLPIGAQVVAAVLAFDLLWYGYHRLAHRRPALWRVHGAHHTPSQLYVLMHGVFHPLDEVVVRFVLALAVFRFGGFSADATFVAVALIGAVGIVSHLNADVRLWAFNHVLAGPETHRYHHSADHAGNYGAVTTVWDQVFHTFVIEARPPRRLGLADPAGYPDPEHFWRVVRWPFHRRGSATAAPLGNPSAGADLQRSAP